MPVDEQTAIADAAKVFDKAAQAPAGQPVAEPESAEPETGAEETPEAEAPQAEAEGEPGQPEAEARPPEEPEPEGDEPPEFSRLYKEDKDLNEFLKGHRHLRDHWFKAAQMLDQFPTVDDAKSAREALVELNEFDRLFNSSRPEDKRELITRLARSSQDPQTGKSSGQYEALANTILDDMTAQLSRAARSGQLRLPEGWQNEHFQAAVAGLRAVLGLQQVEGAQPGGNSTPAGNGAALDQRVQALAQKEQEITQRQDQMFAEAIDARYSDWIGRKVASLVDESGGMKAQPKGFQEYVRNQILDGLKEAMWSDEIFRGQFDSKARAGGRGTQQIGELADMLQKRAEHYLPSIQRKVFREAGAQIEANQAAEDAKRAAVPKRKEPALSSNAAKLARPGSGSDGKPKMNPGESPTAFSRRILQDAFNRAGV